MPLSYQYWIQYMYSKRKVVRANDFNAKSWLQSVLFQVLKITNKAIFDRTLERVHHNLGQQNHILMSDEHKITNIFLRKFCNENGGFYLANDKIKDYSDKGYASD